MQKNNQKNNMWKEDEDRIMIQLVEKYGTKRWAHISQQLHQNFGYKLKTGKQCRERYILAQKRWHNHLNPSIVKKPWSKKEEEIMFDQHRKYGNKWTYIAEGLTGRTDNSIKNHFYSTIRRSLRRMNKLMGSKNSTVKMKNIKPSTLSTIFSLAQGKQSSNLQSHFQLPPTQQINFQQLAELIMSFANWKPSSKSTSLDSKTIEKFHSMLNCMESINQNYELKKNVEMKTKKEKLLKKKFDDISEEHEEDVSENSESEFQSSNVDIQIGKKKGKQKKNQIDFEHKKELKTDSYEHGIISYKQFRKNSQEQIQNQKPLPQKELGEKNEFNINIEEDKSFDFCFRHSPGFFSCTPPGSYCQMMKYSPLQIKNEDCNQILECLKDRIGKRASQGQEGGEERVLYHSPGSAFRYCS